jgi:hypothetical protein
MVNDFVTGIYSKGKEQNALVFTGVNINNPAHLAALYIASGASMMFDYDIKIKINWFKFQALTHRYNLKVTRATRKTKLPELNVPETLKAIEDYRCWNGGFVDIFNEYYKERANAECNNPSL